MGTPNDATGTPAVLAGVSATISNAGSNGTLGTCVVTVSDQTALGGQPTQVKVTVANGSSGGSISTIQSLTANGTITGIANTATYNTTTGAYTEPVTGCNLQGAKLNIKYGIDLEQLTPTTGLYTIAPPCSGSTAVTMTSLDAGTGVTVTCSIYNSTTAFGTDNTVAFQTALGTLNAASAAGTPRCLYFPAGNYLTHVLNTQGANGSAATTGAANLVRGYGCFLGDERLTSNIFVIPDTSNTGTPGDVFAWLDAGANGSKPVFGNTQSYFNAGAAQPALNQGGSSFRNLTIIGDRASLNEQNALTFYGPTSDAYIDNAIVSYMRGRAFGAGYADSAGAGNLVDSRINNVFFDHSGDGTAVATMEITASGGPGSTNIDLENTRVFDSFGPSVWIHAGAGATSNTSGIRSLNMKLEGSSMSELPAKVGDLLLLGGGGAPAGINVSDILCRNLDLANAVFGFAALHVTGDSAADTARIDCSGTMANTPAQYANGLQVDACQQCAFEEGANVNTGAGYGLQVGTFSSVSAPCTGAHLAAPGIFYSSNGSESSLRSCIDPAVPALVRTEFPLLLANAALANATPDGPIEQVTSSITTTAGVTLSLGGNISFSPTAPLWTVLRSGGPTSGPFTDTWDSASNLIGALNSMNGTHSVVGQIYRVRICNNTSLTETLAAGTGVTMYGAPSVLAGSCTNFALEISGITTPAVTIVGG